LITGAGESTGMCVTYALFGNLDRVLTDVFSDKGSPSWTVMARPRLKNTIVNKKTNPLNRTISGSVRGPETTTDQSGGTAALTLRRHAAEMVRNHDSTETNTLTEFVQRGLMWAVTGDR